MRQSVIIIGAGIGGMATAARLAKAGHDVQIFEASDRVGGKCRTEWIGNFAFDTGPSLLTLPAVYRDLFIRTGKRFENEVSLKPVDPSFSYHFHDGKSVVFPNLSHSATCDAMEAAFGSKAGDDWHHLMQVAERMWDASRGPFIESELPSIFSLVKRKNFFSDLLTIAPWKSLRSFTRNHTNNPYIQKIIDRYATYSGSDPRRAPAVLLSIAFMESTFGAWHLGGGLGELANALERRCSQLGVKIHLNSPVQAILIENDQAVGVTLESGIEHHATHVVANADAEIVYNRLISKKYKRVKKERRKLAKAEKSFGGFQLFLGLDNSKITSAIPKLHHHNIFFPENYDAEFDSLFTKLSPPEDPTIYICAPQDPLMIRGESADSKENWSILVNAPRHDPAHGYDWTGKGADYARQIISKLDALGLKVSDRLEVCEFRTPLDLERATFAPGGSIYGTSSNGARAAFARAANRSPLRNLYCVGGSAHPGGGLPLVGMSAELVADAIARADGFTSGDGSHH